MKKIIWAVFIFAILVNAKSLLLPFNEPVYTKLEPGDVVQIEDFPSQWGYNRVVLGIQSSGGEFLEGFLVKENCLHTLVGYYQQVDFYYDGENIFLRYLGNSAKYVTLQWWLDYSVVTSQCRELSIYTSTIFGSNGDVETAYAAYSDLGAINSESIFESANQNVRISDYPCWKHNTLFVQIESKDSKPLNGYVYIGRETLKISGHSLTIPLSRRSFLPASFQISFPSVRKFSIKWWAEYREPQDFTVTRQISYNQGQDSVYCEYGFTGARRGTVRLKYSTDDFIDGEPPVYIAKSTLNGPALEQTKSLHHVGRIYDIHANLSSNKKVTVVLPLEINRVKLNEITIYHEQNGFVEQIRPDSVVNGFIYFQTNSFSDFWDAVAKISKKYLDGPFDSGEAVVDGVASIGETIIDGIQYVNDKLESVYRWIENIGCNVFDPAVWNKLFNDDLGGISTEDWNLPEGIMPDDNYKSYNPALFDFLEISSTQSLNIINDDMSDMTRLDYTRINLDIMLSELVNRKMNTGVESRFYVDGMVYLVDKNSNRSEYIRNLMAVSTALTKYAFDMVRMVNDCYGAINSNTLATFYNETKKLFSGHSSAERMCRNIFEGFGIVENKQDNLNCRLDLLKMLTQCVQEDDAYLSAFKKNRDELILKTTDVLARVALLAYYDKTLRENLKTWFNQTYKSLSVMMEMMGPLMLYNNITIRAEAAMALYEYVYWGTSTHLERMKIGIETHYGDKGGFSEGMGYLQYINEDVPYLMVALKKAYAQQRETFELPAKFYRSGYHLMNMARNIRPSKEADYNIRVPVEVDDGCTYVPEYAVWGTLTKNAKFFQMARRYLMEDTTLYSDYKDKRLQEYQSQHKPIPSEMEIQNDYYLDFMENSKKYGNPLAGSPLVALGYSEWNYKALDDLNEADGVSGAYEDDAAIINYRDQEGKDYSITLVAENGDLWKNGQAHDQQDNVSFTLSSTRDGHVVRDMGYAGFGVDGNTHGYKDHNVLMRPNHPEYSDGAGNQSLNYSTLASRAENYTGRYTGFNSYGLLGLVSNKLADYGVMGAGGSEAKLVDSLREDGVLGYTVYQKTLGSIFKDPLTQEEERIEPFDNFRSIVFFGKTLWLFDQPSDDNLLWVVNGSNETGAIQGTYVDDKIDVYIGNHRVSTLGGWERITATQNSSRGDYLGFSLDVKRQALQLRNYLGTESGSYVLPISMPYSIDSKHSFSLINKNDLPNVQCFERTDGDLKQRVIVPARGVYYSIQDVLPDISESNRSTYNGIMFAERKGKGEWTILGVLNNGERINKTTVKSKYLPSNLILRAR